MRYMRILKLRCDNVVGVAVSWKKKPADRNIRNSETGRIICQDSEQNKVYNI